MNESNELKNLLSTLKIKSNPEVENNNNPKENSLNNQNDSVNINRKFLRLRYYRYILRNNNNLPIEYQKEKHYSTIAIGVVLSTYLNLTFKFKILRKPSFIFRGSRNRILIFFTLNFLIMIALNFFRISIKLYNSSFSGLNEEQIAIKINNLENNKIFMNV